MIALEAMHFMRATARYEKIDDLSGRWSTIYVVSQKDLKRARRRIGLQIRIDARKYFSKQIESAVYVSNGIDACTVWYTGPLRLGS